MVRNSRALWAVILPSFFLMNPASAIIMVYRYLHIDLRDKPSQAINNWAIVFFVFAALMLGAFGSSVNRTPKHRSNANTELSAKTSAQVQSSKHDKSSDFVMLGWFTGSNLITGFLMLRWNRKVQIIQEDATTLTKMISSGLRDLKKVQKGFIRTDAIWLAGQLRRLNMLGDFFLDYENAQLIAFDDFKKTQHLLRHDFHCNNCGAHNQFEIPEASVAHCQYCGTLRSA
jgi:hypothetical protein